MKKTYALIAFFVGALAITPASYAAGVIQAQIGFESPDTYDANGFDRDGIHQDTKTTTDPDGYPKSGNQAPVIGSFSATPTSGMAPVTVNFSHSVSDDVGSPSLSIDYGDGSSGTGLTHTYTSGGNFSAVLTATDEKGASSNASQSLSFSAPNTAPVISSFTASPASGDAPLNVTFSHNISDDYTSSPTIHIDYGDGGTGTSLSRSYPNPGSYVATLTATDEHGLSSSASVNITATESWDCRYTTSSYYWTRMSSGQLWLVWGGNLLMYAYNGNAQTENIGAWTYTRGTHKLTYSGNKKYEVCRKPK